MNRKCFCCFDSINSNNDNDLLRDWLDFSFEKLETNLSNEDRKRTLNFDTFCEKIFDIISDKDSDYVSDYVSDILEDFREDLLQYCIYWNEKYYKTGFTDSIKLLTTS